MVKATSRILTYWIMGGGLALGFALLQGASGFGGGESVHDEHVHTANAVAATLLALFVGSLSLVRFYNKEDQVFLHVGVGFIGTAILDGFHMFVAFGYFTPIMPIDQSLLESWSWVVARLFLSILLFMSWVAWEREQRLGPAGRIPARKAYVAGTGLTVLCFLFLAVFPLPPAYYADIAIHRPEEFLPAVLFGLALWGYLKKGFWRSDAFEHWLVVSLVINVAIQAVVMPFSSVESDLDLDLAHNMKTLSYGCVLVGLLQSIHSVFEREKRTNTLVKAIVEHVEDGIITINERGTIQSVNPSAEKMFGYPAAGMIGQNVRKLAPEPHRQAHDGYLDNYIKSGEAKIIGIGQELEGVRANGELFPMQLIVADMTVDNQRLFLGTMRDLRERRKAERAVKEAMASLQRSNEELEKFAYLSSHDLQEPLRKVQAFGDRLRQRFGDTLGEQGLDYLDRMQGAASRMSALINDLLSFSRVTTKGLPFATVDLNEIVEGVLEDLEISIEENEAKVTVGELPSVKGDPRQLRQLVQNLIGNAIKYRDPARPPEVSISMSGEGNGAGINGTCSFEVRDNGIGFSPDYSAKIFEIFQRLHGRGEYDGTGVGLSIAKRIAERHGGNIHAEGVPGEGAVFTVTLKTDHTEEGEERE